MNRNLDNLAGLLAPGPWYLEADAGTGKTHSMTSLVIFLVALEGVPIEKFLMVTYTKKATAELRERLRSRLAEALAAIRGEKAPEDAALRELVAVVRQRDIARQAAERLQRARHQLDLATVSTIHSFCEQVISRWPELLRRFGRLDFSADYEELKKDLVSDYLSKHRYTEGGGLLDPGAPEYQSLLDLADCLCRHRRSVLLPELPPPAEFLAGLREQGKRLLATLQEALERAQRDKKESTKKAEGVKYVTPFIDEFSAWLKKCEQGIVEDIKKHQWRKKITTKKFTGFLGVEVPRQFLNLVEQLPRFADLPRVRFAEWFSRELAQRLEAERLFTYDDLLLVVSDAVADERTGPELVRRLRQQFPVVLIDEFQDTDLVQWNIFRRAWLEGWESSGVRLYLVGDPKQSIYAFRGADVYVCAHAQQAIPAERQRTLSANWRSDRAYLEALNLLLLGDAGKTEDRELFDLPDFITLRAARYPEEKSELPACCLREATGRALAPIEFRWLAPSEDGDGVIVADRPGHLTSKEPLDRNLAQLVAADIRDLLGREPGSPATWIHDSAGHGKPRPLEPRDIAVLTQTNDRAHAIAAELRRLGIPAVTSQTGSVFQAPAAKLLVRWLDAVLQPGRSGPARALAISPLCGFSASELVAGEEEGEPPTTGRFQKLQQDIASWAEQLRHRNVASVLRQVVTGWLFDDTGGCANNPDFMKRPDAERLLTDWLHLSELVHQFELKGHSGPEAVRQWLLESRVKETSAFDEAQLRLETDRNAVQLFTVHKAKGLQFPVVYLPDFWEGKGTPRAPLTFHRRRPDRQADVELALWVGKKKLPAPETQLAAAEQLQEQMRLFYVALTRARHHCRLFFAFAGRETARAPLTLVLAREAGENLAEVMKTKLEQLQVSGSGSKREETLRRAQQQAGRLFSGPIRAKLEGIERITAALPPLPPGDEMLPPVAEEPPLRLRKAPPLSTMPAAHSYSSLVRGAAGADAEPEEHDHDDAPHSLAPEPEPASPESAPAPAVPAGRKFGDWVHAVLEHIDFAKLAAGQLDEEAKAEIVRLARRSGFLDGVDGAELAGLSDGLRRMLTTPLGGEAGSLALADLAGADRLHELRFALPLAGGSEWAPGRPALEGERLAELVKQALATARLPGRLTAGRPHIHTGRLAGLLYGAIDLVFRLARDGTHRYYLADFKTNKIGDGRPERYRPEKLHQLMLEHDYYLQAVLYSLALHRHLRLSLPGYDPERHFGGAYYLFLRGMQGPESAPEQGIVWLRPQPEALNELDRFIGGEAP